MSDPASDSDEFLHDLPAETTRKLLADAVPVDVPRAASRIATRMRSAAARSSTAWSVFAAIRPPPRAPQAR
jgi:hypothetical protein